MKLSVYDIEGSYKNTFVSHLSNSGTEDCLLHTVQCWSACAVNEKNQALPMVMYCSHIMYTYYSHIGFLPIKHNEEGKDTHNEIFKDIPHFIRSVCMLIVFHMVFFVQE